MTLLGMVENFPRTALYLRISDDRQDGAGVERQERECRELAARLGWQVVALYSDNDISAYAGKHRPGYQSLLESIRTGATEAVICWHSDRLTRQPRELEPYIDLCNEHGVQNAAVQVGKIDLTTASGQMNARMLGAVAYFESQHKAERVKAAHRQIAESGRFHGGIRPYGFESDGTTIRENEAENVRRLAAAVIAGQSLRSLALELNDRRVETVRPGGRWTANYVRRLLLSPRMVGQREYRGKVIGPAAWQPILSRETSEAVRVILEDPARYVGGNRRGPVPQNLGTGIYVCGVCNEPRLRLGRTSTGQPRYRCGNSPMRQKHVARVADKLDEFVTGALLEMLSQPGVVEAIASVIDTGDNEDLAALRSELLTIRPRLNKAATRYAADEIDDEQFAIVSKTLRDRESEIKARLAAANMRSPLDVLIGVDNIERVWDEDLTMGQKRAILTECLTVTVLPTNGKGGRAPDGSYFNQAAVRLEHTEVVRSALSR